ncbi:MAG: flavodoxin-dependent (E)-4-hydroxy-3-methylbut-2-enyl-diphosphate synthase [Lachnospiraceae bacterium]|nr:flavodoxin-dependent (E)-4-hydroxy-3-methylbut-2-enyl-diphosphate synthase [Lachnospiraceae bacterium]
MERRFSHEVNIGGVLIGGNNPIAIQSMTNTRTGDVASTVRQIEELTREGCDIIRCAVPDMEAAAAIRQIRQQIRIPLVADIHFDHRLALAAIENGADKIRINPGNIGGEDKVREVVAAAKERGIPIRVGVNSGSLEKKYIEKYGHVTAEGLVESALGQVEMLERFDFHDIVISIKASDVMTSVKAHELIASRTDHPLHVGITETGSVIAGNIKSAVGIGIILHEGIGDTIRVSLTADPVEEIRSAKNILRALGMKKGGIEVVSCPTCGRTRIDLISLAGQVEKMTADYDLNIKVAVMGCAVNGPGEAREADIGIAGGNGEGLIFKKGEIIKKVPEQDLLAELKAMLDEISAEKR